MQSLNDYLIPSFKDFVLPKYIDAPFTTISGRAKVLDTANTLKAVQGFEKIDFNSICMLQKEFGPNGEVVWELNTKDTRVRFVGFSWVSNSSNNGSVITKPSTTGSDHYIEVTYYGTSLMMSLSLAGSGYNVTQSTDGGAPVSVLSAATFTSVINARNYKTNQSLTVVTGLTQGWHTTRILLDTSSFSFMSIDIGNLTTNMTVTPGQSVSADRKNSLNALTVFNPADGVLGVKGANVRKILKDGVLTQALQETDSTSRFLGATDHSNEEIVRKIHFSEFGSNRSDDFSTLSTSVGNKAYTLPDGSMTLIGLNVFLSNDGLNSIVGNANGSYIEMSFNGTGLDVVSPYGANVTIGSVIVDNVSVGNLVRPTNPGSIIKVCSGLPYGTHRVRFIVTSSSGMFTDFIIYQPKKATLPIGSTEIANYNSLAPYVPSNNQNIISTGVIRKMCMTDYIFSGTWNAPVFETSGFAHGGNYIGTSTAGSYYEVLVFGDAFDLNHAHNTGTASSTVTISVNGSSNLSGFTTAAYGTSLTSFTPSTGALVMNNTPGNNVVSVRGLTLGLYRVRVTYVSGGTTYANSIDVHCPTHINHPSLKVACNPLNSPSDLQANPVVPLNGNFGNAKAWITYNQANGEILSSYNIQNVHGATTGLVFVQFLIPFKNRRYSVGGISPSSQMSEQARGESFFHAALSNSSGTLNNSQVSLVFYGELVTE